MTKIKTNEITDALLDIVAKKQFNKTFKKLTAFEQNYCAKYVLDFINKTDSLKTEIVL